MPPPDAFTAYHDQMMAEFKAKWPDGVKWPKEIKEPFRARR